MKCLFRFSVPTLSETSPIVRRTERYVIKMYIGVHVQHSAAQRRYSCQILLQFEFSRRIF